MPRHTLADLDAQLAQKAPQAAVDAEGPSILPRTGSALGSLLGLTGIPGTSVLGSAIGSAGEELASSVPRLVNLVKSDPMAMLRPSAYGSRGVGDEMAGAAGRMTGDVAKTAALDYGVPAAAGMAARGLAKGAATVGASKAAQMPVMTRAALGPIAKLLGLPIEAAGALEVASVAGPPVARAVAPTLAKVGEAMPPGSSVSGGLSRALQALRPGTPAPPAPSGPGMPFSWGVRKPQSTEIPYKVPPAKPAAPPTTPPAPPSASPVAQRLQQATTALSDQDLRNAASNDNWMTLRGANNPDVALPTEIRDRLGMQPDEESWFQNTHVVSPSGGSDVPFQYKGEATELGTPPAVGGTSVAGPWKPSSPPASPSPEQLGALQKLLALPSFKGLPSDADVAASVASRNASGRW